MPIIPNHLEYHAAEHRGETKRDAELRVNKTMVLIKGELNGYVQLAIYDENQGYQGADQKPVSIVEFPLGYLKPFKPVNLRIKMPMMDQVLEDDLDMDIKDKNWRVSANAHQIYEQREFKKRHIHQSEPELYLSVQL